MAEKRIAVCDDEKIIADELTKMVRIHIKTLNTTDKILVDTYYSAFALEDSLETGKTYDLIFLDIVLKKENGIKLSNLIVKKWNHVKIVFITGYVEYVEDIFSIEPFALLMKPFKEEKVYHIVEKALEMIDEEQKRYITLKTKDGIYKIDIAHLCYVESDGKYLNFIDEEGNQYRTIMTMDEAGSLAGEKLIRCHRCYYVNLNKAERIFEKNIIYKDGKVIPISRNHYKKIYHKFMDTFEKYWE